MVRNKELTETVVENLEDRRKHPRTPLNAKAMVGHHRVWVRNLSPGGIFASMEGKPLMRKGDSTVVKLWTKGDKHKVVTVTGEIKRLGRLGKGRYGLAVQFTEPLADLLSEG